MAETPAELRQEILALAREIGAKYLRLARLLKQVRDRELWKEWGFSSFEEYCEQEVGFRDRKIRYLIATVEGFERAGVTEEEAAELEPSKAAIIADARDGHGAPLLTPATKETWIQKAKTLTTDELRREVALAAGRPVSDEAPKPWTVMLYPDQAATRDQAIGLAKKVAATDVTAVALMAIFQEFIGTYAHVGMEPVQEPAPEEADG